MSTAEAKLFALAKRDREERLFWRWFGIVYGGSITAAYGIMAAHDAIRGDGSFAFTYGAAGFTVGLMIALPVIGTFTPTQSERMAEIWARDPSRARLESKRSDFSIKPLFGGTSVGLAGTF
jgi:hypothetical protein